MRRIEVPSTEGPTKKTIELTPKVIRDPLASKLSTPRIKSSSTPETEVELTDSNDITFCRTLFEIPSLKGVEVSQIAAGGRSSFVNTASGRVLGFGANEYGHVVLISYRGKKCIDQESSGKLVWVTASPSAVSLYPLRSFCGRTCPGGLLLNALTSVQVRSRVLFTCFNLLSTCSR